MAKKLNLLEKYTNITSSYQNKKKQKQTRILKRDLLLTL